MGARQTKFENERLPQNAQKPITVETDLDYVENVLDPRSPHICRTPLNEPAPRVDVYQQAATIPAISTDHPVGLLRKRFFKGFSYNLNDPRSPSAFLNRTPIIFDDVCDKTLNLDDTFSDLFVESKVPPVDGPMQEDMKSTEIIGEEEEIEYKTEELVATPEMDSIGFAATPKSDTLGSQEILAEVDPRSPSIGVERTPIIFTDDVAADEDDMIESILSTLSLEITQQNPRNKPLERIKQKKRISNKSPYRRDMIYEDGEHQTPPRTQKTFDSPASGKRTPLSCVKNHSYLRSRSVEVSGKSLKSRLPLTSFDDTLHKITPVKKILRYSNMENIENIFEF